VRYSAGDVIIREGDPSSIALVVLAGTVKTTKLAASGREVVLELRGPGDVVGELGVIDGEPRSASVVALDRVDALVFSAPAFNEMLRERAGIAHRLLLTIVGRLRQASARQLELGTIDVVGRVCNRLVELATTHGEPVSNGVLVRSAISQHELADWAGVSRDGVVRALHELRELGWVETGRRRVVVVNLAALRHRAGS
jgi:CRP/FNR family cyclic AMP-dependent transcriptional regulator